MAGADGVRGERQEIDMRGENKDKNTRTPRLAALNARTPRLAASNARAPSLVSSNAASLGQTQHYGLILASYLIKRLSCAYLNASITSPLWHLTLSRASFKPWSRLIECQVQRCLGGRINLDLQLLNHGIIIPRIFLSQKNTLYNYGARKVAIFGLGQIGCTPAELGKYDTYGFACVDTINDAVRLFNNRLKPLVDDFNKNLSGAKFTLINITNISGGDPSSAGITVINTPCCNTTKSSGLCYSNQAPCSNRSTYAFWDAFHPTEIINVITAARVYNASSPLDAYPIHTSMEAKPFGEGWMHGKFKDKS
ncbi:hypothetical protein RJ639_014617 [Escallonia herrerae]|uniref:GDSL esterase/lipase n=1 Tax=Escallonia herrerae TaxID=1293975 RepID=A0AA88VEX6_9ASTE|nr:hypothetical protein RJ639_014617 [Escallonia herrerae]